MIQIALFGLGRWGQNILRTLASIPDCTVTIICDPNAKTPDIVSEVAPHTKPAIYQSWKEAARQEFDAAIIATPVSTHTPVALACLERGIGVFIEKPMTANLADANAIAKAAGTYGAKVFVGHVHLYNPAYHAVKKELPGLGPLRYILCEGGNNGPYRDDMSALWDWAPHDIAMLTDLFSGKLTVIDAWGWELLRPGQNLHDTVMARLEAPDKTPIMLHVSWLMPEKRKKITFVGQQSSLVFDDTAKDKVVLYKNMGPGIKGKTVTFQQPEITPIPYSSTSPLMNELTAFINAITKNTPYPTGITQALAVTQIISEIETRLSS